jgi:CRP-like cAMP-binding protein
MRRGRAKARIERLAGVTLFTRCSAAELARADDLLFEVPVEVGRTLVQEGDDWAAFAVIVDGEAVSSGHGFGPVTLGPGACFGETALFDGGTEPATVVAVTPMTLLVAGRWEFRELMKIPGVALAVLLSLVAQLRSARAGVDAMKAATRPGGRLDELVLDDVAAGRVGVEGVAAVLTPATASASAGAV